MRAARVSPSLLPGFGPALGVTLLGLSLVVLAPLAALLATSLRGSPRAFLDASRNARDSSTQGACVATPPSCAYHPQNRWNTGLVATGVARACMRT